MLSFILIGPAGSGKSRLAQVLVSLHPQARIVSTDKIREDLFGDESIQGDWSLIETEVLRQIQHYFTAGNPVIYDATNANFAWRVDLLRKLIPLAEVEWLGLHLTTPLEVCKQQNQQRRRHIPDLAIEIMYQNLQDFPPVTAEGFSRVYSIPYHDGQLDIAPILKELSSGLTFSSRT